MGWGLRMKLIVEGLNKFGLIDAKVLAHGEYRNSEKLRSGEWGMLASVPVNPIPNPFNIVHRRLMVQHRIVLQR